MLTFFQLDSKEIAELLIKKGADIHAKTTYGHNALYFAASSGLLELVKRLIEEGVNPNRENNLWRHNALYVAKENGYTEIAEALKAAGAILPEPI